MPTEASPTPRSRLARVRRCARIFLTHLVSQVGLCLLVVAYAIVGALIFRAIEADKEVHQRQRVSQLRRRYLRDMWDVTERLNVFHDEQWMDEVGVKLKEFEDEVVLAVRNDGYDGKDVQEEALQWSFSGSLLYSITVITTIGYGNIAPKTPPGKVVTILYAIIGIPLMLLCLSNIGNILAHSFKFFYAHVCCLLCRRADAAAAKIQASSTAKTPSQIPSEVLDAVVTVANNVSKGDNNGSVTGMLTEKSGRPPELSPPPSPEKLAASPSSANELPSKRPTKESTPVSQVPGSSQRMLPSRGLRCESSRCQDSTVTSSAAGPSCARTTAKPMSWSSVSYSQHRREPAIVTVTGTSWQLRRSTDTVAAAEPPWSPFRNTLLRRR